MRYVTTRIPRVLCVVALVAAGCDASGQAKPEPAQRAVKPGPSVEAGSAVLPCVADADIAAYPMGVRSLTARNSEQGTNAGQSPRLKIKKFENRPILRFDFSGVPAGATLTEATLEFHLVGVKGLNQVGVSSLHVDWNEGEATWDDAGRGGALTHKGACFLGPKGVKSRWREYSTGDFNKADAGNGGNATCVARAADLGGGKRAVKVDPYVIQAAMEHGQSLVLTDETGLFTGNLSNANISSRHVKGKEPVLKVRWAAGRDSTAPAFKKPIAAEAGQLAGSILLHLPQAGDDGAEGQALGYRVSVNGKEVPRVQVPRPTRLLRGMLLRGLAPGKIAVVTATAFDEAGNTCSQTIRLPARADFTTALAEPLTHSGFTSPATETNKSFSATIVDGETLFDPFTGKLSRGQTRSYAKSGKIEPKRLVRAVRGEIVGLQCLIQLKDGVDKLGGITIAATDLTGSGGKIAAANFEFFREHYVKMGPAWIADILPTVGAGEKLAIPSQPGIKGQRILAVYVDLLVDKATKPGFYAGKVVIDTSAGKASCPLVVWVRDVTLPDELTFTIEMNAYGHSSNLKVFHDTYRLCHKHRLSYNVLGYGHSRPGSLTTPKLNSDSDASIAGKDVRVVDWSNYDKFYGPVFSGEIAKDLPRKGVAATHWYLPLHDGWPSNLKKCNPDLWKGRVQPRRDKPAFDAWMNHLSANDPLIDEHFTREWKEAAQAVCRQFREHFREKGWTRTSMQIFNNHKYYFSSGSQSLWTMDEPQYARDYRALNWMYAFFNEALAGKGIHLSIRADVSRPEFMGDRMDDSLDLMVVSGAVNNQPRLLEDILLTTDASLWWYGGGGRTNTDPASYMALFTDRWTKGCDGGMPVYTTFAGTNTWNATGSLRVVRFHPKTSMPVASFRMKAYRRAQQDVELYNILAAKGGFNRWHLRDLIRKEFSTRIVTKSRGPDDPGYSTFEKLDVANFDKVREKVIATILRR